MEKNQRIIDELTNSLETKGEISLTNETNDLFIESVDDKEGYSYVSSTNEEFGTSKEAVEWLIKKVNGVENTLDWK
ncbi:hypothetical protein [Clostridium folliculivorans]|uniref:Uncharacterized protein n=1 Tax=Clostridium folliculivorans TaxID=2886038 RepID=A0A9W5Y0W0_9CLOT|nr:hypothetical protein [Clostridium folliculivorans]GKU24651.1 hypothetical protein CFOLD11_14770 [Clostridium folliculivorans]GKU30749.1 hypothetical protein CFB3_28560 [Clostridium folliculivorans]